MLQEERYETILSLLKEKKHLTVDEVRESLNISFSTVRRDFRALVDRNVVRRSRGGISLATLSKDDGNVPFELRRVSNVKEKEALAKAAVALLKPHDSCFIDGGTTTLQMAKFLPSFPLTVVTNSLPHVSLMIQNQTPNSQTEIYTAGGYVYVPWHVNLGPQARYCLSQYHAKFAFLSGRGIDETGVYNHNEMVVEIERAMMENSDHSVFMIDHTKLGKRSMSFLCKPDEIDTLITSNLFTDRPLLKKFQDAGIHVIVVNV